MNKQGQDNQRPRPAFPNIPFSWISLLSAVVIQGRRAVADAQCCLHTAKERSS